MASIVPVAALGVDRAYEAEGVVAEKDAASPGWKVGQAPDASAKNFLLGNEGINLPESPGLPIEFPGAGRYWIWVRYQSGGVSASSSFYTLVRDETGEGIAIGKFDWIPYLPTERPWLASKATEGKKDGNWAWSSLAVTAERPMKGTVHFGALRHGGKNASRKIDRVILTSHKDFDPRAAVTENGVSEPRVFPRKEGLIPAAGFPLDTGFFAGTKDPDGQFSMGLGYSGVVYRDEARFVQLGFNRTHSVGPLPPLQYGVRQMKSMDLYYRLDPGEAKKYPFPEGRFVNADGQTGQGWSLSFAPLRDGLFERTKARIDPIKEDATVESLRIVAESGGSLDYSKPAQAAFRRWLKEEYGSVNRINEIWQTSYRDFDEIEAPKDAGNKAAWFAFRQFSGRTFAEAVREQSNIVRQLDPKRKRLQQLSNIDLLSPKFTSMRPIDWEEFIDVALKDNDSVSWDDYSVDDYMGAEIDLVRSLAGNRTLLNEEWNTHVADPRIVGRTFWTMVGKGLKGVHCFIWQEGMFHDSYPKWALLNPDFTPKAKLGAIADAAQEVHRLERLLMPAKPLDTVKPVALYYSRLDLSLARPLASAWGEPVDTPYHVYATLRGMGYPVRWITPKQIEQGVLREVSSVILVDAQYIPSAAAKKLGEWVHEGGSVVGDRWPGAFDEYGRAQESLAGVFGIQAKDEVKKEGGQLALQESTQGYGEVTLEAITGKDLPNTVGEIWQQWDSTHPVAKEVGTFTLSGYGRKTVRCLAGRVIGMTFGGAPGIVINQYGKGQAMYVSLMLGSLYESAATRYEWDTTHSGTAFPRLLDSFLRHAGAKPFAVAELPLRKRLKLRVERPLADQKGNALFMLTSMNDEAVQPFGLRLCWPGKLPYPKMLLAVTNGTRRIAPVPFKMEDGKLVLIMPSFDTHATLLSLTDSDPLVSLEVEGAGRGEAGLLGVEPGAVLELRATVYNPSSSRVPEGQVALWAPKGWFLESAGKKCPSIEAWGHATLTFHVKAPSVGGPARLRPLVAKHLAGEKTSTPATEEIWWNPAERNQDEPKGLR